MNKILDGCIRLPLKEKGYNGGKHVRIFRAYDKPNDGCWAYIGYPNSNFQHVNLDYGCVTEGTIIHELMHVLGFHHEQNRPDWDVFISPNYQLLESLGWLDQWQKQTQSLTFGVCYNPKGVMQYEANKYSNEWDVESKVCTYL